MVGDMFLDFIRALNEILYISKYVTNYEGKYKKDKKVIKKMLKDVENGNGEKYLKGCIDDYE